MKHLIIAAAFAGLLAGTAHAAAPTPTENGDFDHYTFALTWQPGFCATDAGCLPDQPATPLIGLHGLWASRPQALIDRGVSEQAWDRRGCDLLHHSDAEPVLPDPLRQQLAAVMPHLAHDLLHHEYDKHVQCFGFDPASFFGTELAMRERIADSAFARDLQRQAGHTVRHADVVSAFQAGFQTTAPRALQLQCGHDPAGASILTELWITLPTNGIDGFPTGPTLIDSPTVQDNCPATFDLPGWAGGAP